MAAANAAAASQENVDAAASRSIACSTACVRVLQHGAGGFWPRPAVDVKLDELSLSPHLPQPGWILKSPPASLAAVTL